MLFNAQDWCIPAGIVQGQRLDILRQTIISWFFLSYRSFCLWKLCISTCDLFYCCGCQFEKRCNNVWSFSFKSNTELKTLHAKRFSNFCTKLNHWRDLIVSSDDHIRKPCWFEPLDCFFIHGCKVFVGVLSLVSLLLRTISSKYR